MYIDKKELYNEICISLERDELTHRATEMLILIAQEASNKLVFKNPMDKEDCISFAILDLLRYWKNFDPVKYDNAFAYYTQIAKHGYAKGWGKLHPVKHKGTISLSNSNSGNGIYTV